VWFKITKVDGQWFVCVSLLYVPNVRHFVAFVFQCLFDVVNVCGGMDIFKRHSETSVLSGFIGVEFGVFIHKGFDDCCIDRTFCWLDFHLVIR